MIARLEQLEQLVNLLGNRNASLEARMAALEQNRWQFAGGASVSSSGVPPCVFSVTTGASAASGGTPSDDGRGTAEFWNGSSYDAGETGVVLYNVAEQAVPSGYVIAEQDTFGQWWILTPIPSGLYAKTYKVTTAASAAATSGGTWTPTTDGRCKEVTFGGGSWTDGTTGLTMFNIYEQGWALDAYFSGVVGYDGYIRPIMPDKCASLV